jgi:hypothetical protein
MIYPMFALILLTFMVAGYLLRLRITAVKVGEVKLSIFKLNHAENMPVKILQAARNYANLFEIPMFFYAAGCVSIALQMNSSSMALLAWLFVLSRAIHSWIHLTNNNVIHRLQAFMAGNICVLLMWVILVWKYTDHSF